MRAPLLLVALALAVASCKKPSPSTQTGGATPSASAAPEQTGVLFKRKLPTAGNVSVIDDTFDMTLDMKNAKGGAMSMANRSMHKRKRTTQRVNDKFVTKVGVEYLDEKEEQ